MVVDEVARFRQALAVAICLSSCFTPLPERGQPCPCVDSWACCASSNTCLPPTEDCPLPFDASISDAGFDGGDAAVNLTDGGPGGPSDGGGRDGGGGDGGSFADGGLGDAGQLGLRCFDDGGCRPLHVLVLEDSSSGVGLWTVLQPALAATRAKAISVGAHFNWDGAVPTELDPIDVVVWLQANNEYLPLSDAGAQTLVRLVNSGTGLVRTEWASWLLSKMRDAGAPDVWLPVTPSNDLAWATREVVVEASHPVNFALPERITTETQYANAQPAPGAHLIASSRDGGSIIATEYLLGTSRVTHLNCSECLVYPSCVIDPGLVTLSRNLILYTGRGVLRP